MFESLLISGALTFAAAGVYLWKSQSPQAESGSEVLPSKASDAASQKNAPPPPEKATPATVYHTSSMFASDTQKIRQQMEVVLKRAGEILPTESQWSMILSPSYATRVIAGAGSGKSTSLSLRVVVLHLFLGIPLEHITVVTFTRASRADMVRKIIRDLGTFGVAIPDDAARRIVRTFHSMILSQADKAQPTEYFEQIGGSANNTDDTEDLGALNPKQLGHLREVYAAAFRGSDLFRNAIAQILLEKLSPNRQARYADSESLNRAIAVAEPRDRVVTQAVTDAWMAKPGFNARNTDISWQASPIKTSQKIGSWHINGRIVSTGLPIVLGCGAVLEAAKSPLDLNKYSIGEKDRDRSLGFINNVRLKIVATIATEKYLYIESDEDLLDLYALLDMENQTRSSAAKSTFPAFSLRIPGDSSSASIFESLYNLGSFMASMTVDVPAAATSIAAIMDKNPDTRIEANLCRALSVFWSALHQPGYSSYDDLFLRHGNIDHAKTLPKEQLLPMKNLLIDEFQDISGQIVRWVKTVQTVLAQQGERPSLMAVGDDWQSVYGWRGSDPDYIIRFDEHFGTSNLVMMNENFRCPQTVIRIAEQLVRQITDDCWNKYGVASGPAAAVMGEVNLMDGDDRDILQLVETIKTDDPNGRIFILSRTNEGLVPFRRLGKNKNISLMTMHRAKGLEADYVIIKGDSSYTNTSPLKNAIYALAGMPATYDSAQQDEALRLAYVSITRARKHAYWFGEPSKPEGAFRMLSELI